MSDLSEGVEEAAKKRGLHVVAADGRHLQLDLDGVRTGAQEYVLEILEREGLVEDYAKSVLMTRSQNGGRHAYIKLDLKPGRKLQPAIRIALQAALGSDPVRETLALLRTGFCRDEDRRDPPLTLFETDEEYPRVMQFLGRKVEGQEDAA